MEKPAQGANELVDETDNFKKLVTLVDNLRDIGLSDHISMPRIAVLGSQSSGKSSLLESIVGLNFLPRGSGVVTRRPLELRLIRSKDPKEKPYGLFKADPKTPYTDFNKIRIKIEQLTDELCGSNKNIVDDPIILQVFSPNCPDLTVIDLPGITRIPIGNQPKDIERITKEMVTRYCKDERTIILAVIPANADMTTSEALQLAQQLDPNGVRTLGVITKIDIMDRGTDARNMLLNKEVKLRLGYVGVKGRSQEDIDNKVSVKQALQEELDYFANHNAYKNLQKELLGTTALIRKLTTVMYDHMKNVLPSIFKEIDLKIRNIESNLEKLGVPIPEDNKEKLDSIWRDVSLFYDKFKSTIKGEHVETYSKEGPEKMKVLASAQINILFNNLYKNYLQSFKASQNYRESEIEKIVGMYSGNTLPGFVSIDCFIALLSPLLDKLRKPALDLLEKVYSILKTVGSAIINEIFKKTQYLKEIVLRLFNEVLEDCREKTEDMINKFMDCETRVVFTKDPEYIINSHSWPEEPKEALPPAQAQVQAQPQGQQGQNQNPGLPNGAQNPVNQRQGQGVQPITNNPQKPPGQDNQNQQQSQVEDQTADDKGDGKQKLTKSERREFLIKEMKKRIDLYFNINVRQVGDMIPKIIQTFLINEILVR